MVLSRLCSPVFDGSICRFQLLLPELITSRGREKGYPLCPERCCFLGALPETWPTCLIPELGHTPSTGIESHAIPRIRLHSIHWNWVICHPLELGHMASTGIISYGIPWDWAYTHLRKWSYHDWLGPRFCKLQLNARLYKVLSTQSTPSLDRGYY